MVGPFVALKTLGRGLSKDMALVRDPIREELPDVAAREAHRPRPEPALHFMPLSETHWKACAAVAARRTMAVKSATAKLAPESVRLKLPVVATLDRAGLLRYEFSSLKVRVRVRVESCRVKPEDAPRSRLRLTAMDSLPWTLLSETQRVEAP